MLFGALKYCIIFFLYPVQKNKDYIICVTKTRAVCRSPRATGGGRDIILLLSDVWDLLAAVGTYNHVGRTDSTGADSLTHHTPFKPVSYRSHIYIYISCIQKCLTPLPRQVSFSSPCDPSYINDNNISEEPTRYKYNVCVCGLNYNHVYTPHCSDRSDKRKPRTAAAAPQNNLIVRHRRPKSPLQVHTYGYLYIHVYYVILVCVCF